MNHDFDKIRNCSHHDPYGFLGAHFDVPVAGKVTLRTFQPHMLEVRLRIGDALFPMEKTHDAGLFEISLETDALSAPVLDPFHYQYELQDYDGNIILRNDPYRFPVLLGEQDTFLFNAGRNYRIYEHLGAHQLEVGSIQGTAFRVWAPNAVAVSVVGNFNHWDGRVHLMRSLGASGIWEIFLPQISQGELYKFHIKTQTGDVILKADPYQFYGELRPQTASIVHSVSNYSWQDERWQQQKKVTTPYARPMSIYEVHMGSWQRDPGDPDRLMTYIEVADALIPHVKKLGFTHIELMPVMEHPLDESWGYQVTAPFSITSRYGTPEEFMRFVDLCHQNDIGIILDWVPAHFPTDSHSLGWFDGTALYEHSDQRQGFHPEWGTYIYNYGRNEVSNYLIANALFWLEKYHIDGLRVDAVASMLYRDYARKEGEWVPNHYGGRENLEAIEFLRHMNSIVYDKFPNVIMVAEESTSFYGVSKPTDQGGLGFGFKWNMGWMNDILLYFSKDPVHRKYHHNNLTFSIMYAFSENFILPLSHDEVVHGKKSLLNKMPGDTWQKFANVRLLLTTMWMHPGKKLLFMGAELGQWSEWYCKRSLDWHLLKENDLHWRLENFVSDLNALYVNNQCLWELDFSAEGFKWLDLEDRNNSIISFARFGDNREDHLVCILNFTPQVLQSYRIGLPFNTTYEEIFSSDAARYGGSDVTNSREIRAESTPYGQAEYSSTISIPPLGGIILRPIKG